jgi:tetratricopeptide (TPR) repeat protein
MSSPRRLFCWALFALATLAPTPAVTAQEDWTWPDRGKNLQVFPKDFPKEKLQAVMKGFTRTLGVRCPYCHVGQEGKPLSTFDFASDANPNKARARQMYLMLGDINQHLAKIEPSGDRRVNMWCGTCHQGRPRPTSLEEALGEAYRRGGATAAVSRYHELRDRFYGRGAYDFGERSLDSLGEELLEKGDRDGAIAMFRLNTSEFPQSSEAWASLAAGYLASGEPLLAKIYYRKSVELDPQNGESLEKLRALEAPPRD